MHPHLNTTQPGEHPTSTAMSAVQDDMVVSHVGDLMATHCNIGNVTGGSGDVVAEDGQVVSSPDVSHAQSATDAPPLLPGGGQAVPPAAAGQPERAATGQGTAPTPPAATDVVQRSMNNLEKRTIIRQQLVLMLHAHKCMFREAQLKPGEVSQCIFPQCKIMKGILKHLSFCENRTRCTVPNCALTRQIINHWKNCNSDECTVCSPMKQTFRDRINDSNSWIVIKVITGL